MCVDVRILIYDIKIVGLRNIGLYVIEMVDILVGFMYWVLFCI